MVIAVLNQKGGVGKTTISYFLGRRSSKERYTCLIDLDPQSNLTGCFVDALPAESNVKVLFEKDRGGNDLVLSAMNLEPNLFMVGSDPELSFWEASNNPSQYFRIARWLEGQRFPELLGKEPLTIIDCPPNLGVFSVNAMLIADFLLIPVDASKFSVQSLETLVHTVHEVNADFRPKNPVLVAGIVYSAVNPRLNFTKRVMEEIGKKYERFIMKTIIPNSTHVREAIADHVSIEGPALEAYESLYQELWERVK